MTEQDRMAAAIAIAQAAMATDEVVQNHPPGTTERRERMRRIIAEVAAAEGVERMDLTMALTQLSTRKN
jgi:hypothetical protein